MEIQIFEGDLLDQDVEVIVNAWNRNIIPGGYCSRMEFRVLSSDAVVLLHSASLASWGRFRLAVPLPRGQADCRTRRSYTLLGSACGGDHPIRLLREVPEAVGSAEIQFPGICDSRTGGIAKFGASGLRVWDLSRSKCV